MLDLAEGMKVIHGYNGTGLLTSGYADVINMENLHCVWAICNVSSSGTGANEFPGVCLRFLRYCVPGQSGLSVLENHRTAH